MAITKQTMIKKMIAELKLANNAPNDQKLAQHIASVRALCEVILEDQSMETGTTDDISDQELKAMLGHTETKANKIEDDDLSGDSIFDF